MSELALLRIREAKEQRLTRLDLGNCGLTELPDELFGLTWLEELNLGTEWYNPISNLTNLTNNIGTVNRIKNIPNKISSLNNLKALVICGVRGAKMPINDISNIGELKKLRLLNISGSLIENIDFIKSIPQLNYLICSNTKISNIDIVNELKNLIFLDVRVTNIKKIDLFCIKDLYKNTIFKILYPIELIVNPPREILKKGNEAINNYFNQIEKQGGTIDLYEAKLIIVGEGATGKTTLFEKLKDKNYQIGSPPKPTASTFTKAYPSNTPISETTLSTPISGILADKNSNT